MPTPTLDPAAVAATASPPASPAAALAGLVVPEKFRDPRTGEVRVDALLKSYLDLERKLAAMVPAPRADMPTAERRRLESALGVPGDAAGYQVSCPHGLFRPDPEVNARLHAAAFTADQAQLVYDLAAERLVPLVRELAAEFQADREIERLVAYFGGADRWREVSRQMLAWAKRNLPQPAVDGLSTSFDGVLALYKMMTSGEAGPMRSGGANAAEPLDETALHAMVRDPRYWRDRDPAMVRKVTDSFRRLYGDDAQG